MFGCQSVFYSDKLPSLANPLQNSYTERISREVQMFNLSIIFEKGKRVALYFSYYCINTVSPWKLNLRAHLHLNCLSSQEHLGLFHYNWKQPIMSSLFLENGFIRGINIISLSFFNLWFSYLHFSWFGVIIKTKVKNQMKHILTSLYNTAAPLLAPYYILSHAVLTTNMPVYMTGLPRAPPCGIIILLLYVCILITPTSAEKPPILKFYLNSTSTSVFAVRFFF